MGDNDKDSFDCELDVVELLGKEKIMYAKLPKGREIIISVPGHINYIPGNTYKFLFDREVLHFFDSETEKRIN
mgnify:CR=1 FL=1